MKRILCRLAQRRLDPAGSQAGWLARHLDSCADCRAYFDEVRSIEHQLHSAPPESDDALSDAIMAKIEAAGDAPRKEPVPPVRIRPWILGATGLAATAALVFAVISLTNPAPDKPATTAPPEAVPGTPATPEPEIPAQALAQMMRQQELLQRDARKLGAHLRDRVILFRPLN